ncbi:Nisin biosynthesis protein NisC [Streptomyces sp. RB5]|uniref:Nisin biosynthesis protein NisC n=1 Tax=Streptomyces smaragdinus TaxID=2585196 RepID=A0A7K0CDA9_9ACTN|nr:lanthionine synthetase C family protein [Streptomyces smaragdinus]MQY11451.1 Nisin biosynthesis protein NisC [Streptomyces smaragdinus]
MIHPLAARTAESVAELLADPAPATADSHRQHLAYGPTGIALLHIERAALEEGSWQRAHSWLTAATHEPFTSGPGSHPFYGAPALAHALACVAEHLPDAYRGARKALHRQLSADVRRRLESAHRRADAKHLPELAEFDTIRGLVGYGSYLLRHHPSGSEIRSVLDYCVRLTEPIVHEGETLPGWWTLTGPSGRPDDRFPGGHANTGMAHGIGGVLALLALAVRRGVTVEGHREAISVILGWLDQHQGATGSGVAWPYWVTRDELRANHSTPAPPRRPSWCYGTVGIARAQQLAALALGQAGRQIAVETAAVAALADPAQLKVTTDTGLCHGVAGLCHVAARIAGDAHASTAGQLRAAIPPLLDSVCPPGSPPEELAKELLRNEEAGNGLLNGTAGTALALLAPATTGLTRSSWDSCLLIA